MASFTDAISNFNPYIQELPLEAMLRVGMYKQAKYEEGVQKIQSYVDNVAGLEVARPKDKEYLQSKLGELGNRLKTVAAGDFSNQQLVNSVSGMAGSLIKDDNIQNAVSSTANIKKQAQIMDAARQKGELAPENEDLYNDNLNKYLYSTEEKASFINGKYIPYTNVFKKLKDAADAVGIDSQDIPQIFETDNRGNPIPDGKGSFKWNPIMATEKLKGKDVGKLLSMFKASLTPQDYQQLAITGRYNYKNANEEQLAGMIKEDYSSDKSKLTAAIDDVRLKLYNEEGSQKPDREKITNLAEQYKYYNDLNDGLDKSIQSEIENMANNPDATKGSLYTRKYLNTIAMGMSGIEKSKSYSINPNYTVWNDNRNFLASQQRERNAQKRWQYEQEYKANKDKSDTWQEQLKMHLEFGTPPPPGYKPKQLKSPFDVEGGEAYDIVNQKKSEYSNVLTATNQAAYALTIANFKGANPKNPNEKDEAYDQRIAKMIANVAKVKGVVIDPNSGDINDLTNEYASEMVADWKKGKNIPLPYRDLVRQYNNGLKDATTMRGQLEQFEKKAIAQASLEGVDVKSNVEIKKGIKPVTLDIKNPLNGTSSKVTLTTDDVMDWAMINGDYFNIFGGLTMDKSQESNKQAAILRQQAKLGNKFNQVGSNIRNVKTAGTSSYNYLHPSIEAAGHLMNSAGVDKKTKILAKLYQDAGYLTQPLITPVNRGKNNKDDIDNNLVQIVDNYVGVSSNAEAMKAAILSADSKVGIRIIPKGQGLDNDYRMVVTKKDGTSEELPIQESDYEFMFGQAPRSAPVPKILNQINAFGTSNLGGSSNPSTTWWGTDDFTNLKGYKYGVVADLLPDPGADKNKLWFNMTLYDKKTGDVVDKVTYPDAFYKIVDGQINTQLDALPTGINPAVLEKIRK
jgi:hypothetical protein